VSKHVGV